MYRIKAQNKVDSRLLVQYPDAKERVIMDMVVGFAKEMHKQNCFEITEIDGKCGADWMRPDEKEFIIEGFVMTPKEFKEAIETLHLIKSGLPEPLRGYANHLHSILTKEPLS